MLAAETGRGDASGRSNGIGSWRGDLGTVSRVQSQEFLHALAPASGAALHMALPCLSFPLALLA